MAGGGGPAGMPKPGGGSDMSKPGRNPGGPPAVGGFEPPPKVGMPVGPGADSGGTDMLRLDDESVLPMTAMDDVPDDATRFC